MMKSVSGDVLPLPACSRRALLKKGLVLLRLKCLWGRDGYVGYGGDRQKQRAFGV